MYKPKVVLAGAAGFLGSTLQKHLGKEYQFIPLVRDPKTGEGDLARTELKIQLPKADILFHAAGLTTGRSQTAEAPEAAETNTRITANLITLCRAAGVPKIIFASSYVYGCPRYLPVDEQHPLQALSPYMQSKIDSELLLEKAAKESSIHVVALRLFNLYGPGQRQGLLIPDILAQLAQKELTLGDDRPKRDFVHVHDVARAFQQAAESTLGPFEAFNIAGGKSYSVQDVVSFMTKAARLDLRVRFNREQRPIDIPDVVGNIQKASALLKWSPQIPFEEGIQSLVRSALQPA